ncbi:MAG TPA: DNA primase [Anaerolineaceae bacterium]|nr:DNA primase [Anaerolineaceae bacterium]
MTAVDEIKARLDIVDIVSETVKLRRSGRSYTGFCPFHPNTKTPAFAVFPDSGTWRCFGQCNEGGDIFKFVMKREGWDFAEALKYLAQKAGVTLEPLTPERKEQEDQFEVLRGILEESVKFYQHQLLKTPSGKPAFDYLINRGINEASIEKFELGYAPDAYEALLGYLNGKGHSLEQLAEAGLVNERDNGSYYDKFRNRIMFPIRDAAGKMTGFGARILNPTDVPKFLNSPQTPLFNKSRLLYGLHLAKKTIRESDRVVIVEGYLDVIATHQGGFSNTVSPMGTAINEDQLRYLKKFTRRIVLALDADTAGEKATMRGVEVARQALDRETELVFDPRGLLQHEARLQADVRVTTLPAGLDPDDVVLKDPANWQKIVEEAKPIVVHVMDSLAAGQDLEDAKVRASIAAQVIPLIEDVPSAVERDTYRQRLARLLKVDEQSLLGSQKVRTRARRSSRETVSGSAILNPQVVRTTDDQRCQQLEKHCLSLLLKKPGRYYELERSLKLAGLDSFKAGDFEDSQNNELAQLFIQGIRQDALDPQEYVKENANEELLERLREMLEPQEGDERDEERFSSDLYRTMISLRQIHIHQVLNQLRFMQDDETELPEEQALQQLILANTLARGKLDQALAKTTTKR